MTRSPSLPRRRLRIVAGAALAVILLAGWIGAPYLHGATFVVRASGMEGRARAIANRGRGGLAADTLLVEDVE